jgi:predicted RNA-binding Zn-ribbon protein involved in translation (DUF1610 family)
MSKCPNCGEEGIGNAEMGDYCPNQLNKTEE